MREFSLVLKCHNLENAEIQTSVYRMPDCFKLYVSDVGILSAMMGKAGNNASASFDRMLQRDDIQIGYKFVNGNIGRFGKKVTLPHYMSMFI